MNKKEYKKWLGLLCAMIGLCVILLSVYYWRIRETANSQHSYLQIEASEEQFQDKTGYIEVREMEQQFIVDENELTEFNVMFRKLEQQAEEPVQVELLKATDRESVFVLTGDLCTEDRTEGTVGVADFQIQRSFRSLLYGFLQFL